MEEPGPRDSVASRPASLSEPKAELSHLTDVARHLRQMRSASLRGAWDAAGDDSSPTEARRRFASNLAQRVVDFSGDMDDLLRACADAPPGTVLDMGGATITATVSLTEAVVGEASESVRSSAPQPSGHASSTTSNVPESLHAKSHTSNDNGSGSSSSGGSNESPADAGTPSGTLVGGPAPSATCWSSVLAPDYQRIQAPGLERLRLESQEAVHPCESFPAATLLPTGGAPPGRRLPEPSSERRLPWHNASLESTGSVFSDAGGRSVRRNLSFGPSETGSIASQPSDAYVSARIGQGSLSSVNTSVDALDSACKVENLYASHVVAPLGAPPATPPILVLAGRDITVRNGSLRLPAHHMLVIEGASITLEDIKLSGEGSAADPKRSLPLVFVSHATATLKSVSVCRNQMGHGVGVGAHGHLDLLDCELDANRTSGLVARGDSAVVHVHGTRFAHNGQDGATVSAGAIADFRDCKFRQNTMLGLGVSGRGSSATVSCCAAQRNGDHGFVAHRAASLELNDCSSTGNSVGVLALGAGSKVQWTEGSVTSCRQGMHVCEGATATVVNGDSARNDIGFCVSDANSMLSLDNCSVISARTNGVQIVAGGVCHMTGCTVTKSASHGAVVQHKRSRLVAVKSTFQLNGAAGVHLSIMAQAELTGCSLKSNKVAGLQATDTGTLATVRRCKLVRNATIGAFVNKGATCTLADCHLDSNGSSGCEVRDRQSSAVARDTAFADNGRVGVYAHSSATVELISCQLSGNQAFELLCGGREGADIGGGTTSYCPQCHVGGGTMVRHGGRIFQSVPCESSPDNELPVAAAATGDAAAAE